MRKMHIERRRISLLDDDEISKRFKKTLRSHISRNYKMPKQTWSTVAEDRITSAKSVWYGDLTKNDTRAKMVQPSKYSDTRVSTRAYLSPAWKTSLAQKHLCK